MCRSLKVLGKCKSFPSKNLDALIDFGTWVARSRVAAAKESECSHSRQSVGIP
jgi:hypothetical protein